ncbi:hypothetical protein B0T18DRAFT_40261 [Schizothecium vesticola]|uniref:Uncharacterized protein n=1 Tax=Schizothecium vesticola TaxID=314040 RepID=A0AA40FC56_9PEZI|nr:hypothetical protein B0T18DRAFT_40261 [Schizothecium vesticola]
MPWRFICLAPSPREKDGGCQHQDAHSRSFHPATNGNAPRLCCSRSMEHDNTTVERRSGLTLYQTQRRERGGGNPRASWWMRGWQQINLDCIRNHQTSTAKPLRSRLELCRPHRSGVCLAMESDCRPLVVRIGRGLAQVNGGHLNTISAIELVTALALPGIALPCTAVVLYGCLAGPPRSCTEIASGDKRTASVPHACIPSQRAAIAVTSPKGSRFGLMAGSAGHADAAAAAAALHRGDIANAFRCTPAVPAGVFI